MTNLNQASWLGRVAKALSAQRLHPFHPSGQVDNFEAIARYTWNVALCEAFYPLLHTLEITLRNSLDVAIAASFPAKAYQLVPSWLDANPPILEPQSGQLAVTKAKKKLLERCRRTGNLSQLTPGMLVAEMEFGFWTGLLSTYYMFQSSKDPRFWPHLLPATFPHLIPRPKHPSEIAKRLHEIRRFRNRVFHHEPIWSRTDLARDRQQILEAIAWISPEAATTAGRLDRVAEMLSKPLQRRIRVAIHRCSSGKP